MRVDLAALRLQLIQIATAADTGDGAHDLSHLERVWKAASGMLAHHPEADAMIVTRDHGVRPRRMSEAASGGQLIGDRGHANHSGVGSCGRTDGE